MSNPRPGFYVSRGEAEQLIQNSYTLRPVEFEKLKLDLVQINRTIAEADVPDADKKMYFLMLVDARNNVSGDLKSIYESVINDLRQQCPEVLDCKLTEKIQQERPRLPEQGKENDRKSLRR